MLGKCGLYLLCVCVSQCRKDCRVAPPCCQETFFIRVISPVKAMLKCNSLHFPPLDIYLQCV